MAQQPVNPVQPTNPAASGPIAGYGTLSLADLYRVNNSSILDFGLTDVLKAMRALYAQYNQIMNQELDFLCFRTKQRTMGVGGPVNGVSVSVDEYGVSDVQKQAGAGLLGFPLRKYQYNTQWTREWLRKHTPADMAGQVLQALNADRQRVNYEIKRALFTPTNSSVVDRLTDFMTIPVKALANNDGFPMPPGQSGTIFDPLSHLHIVGTTSAFPTNSEIATLILNVSEHFTSGTQRLFVNQAGGNYLTTNAGSYPDFVPMSYAGYIYSTTVTRANGTIDQVNQSDRMIGLFRGVEVWVKPWIPAAVMVTVMGGADKVLAMRVPDDAAGDNGDFRMVYEEENFPLDLTVQEREFGLGVVNRIGAAALSYGGGDTVYVMPTFTV